MFLVLFAIIILSVIYFIHVKQPQITNTRHLNMAAEWDAFVKRSLTKYRHRDKTKRDVLLVIKEYKALRPKVDFYTFNDGTRKELFSVTGTIPINFKGNTYNIPICIWLMDTHPDVAPLCFVTPTPDMHIRQSVNVDTNGRIYIPYLQDWKYPSSDLIGLVQVLSAIFSENSPLYAKSVGANPSYSPLPTKRHAPVLQSSPGVSLTIPKYMEAGVSPTDDVQQLQCELRLLKQRLHIMELESDGYPEKSKPAKYADDSTELCKICTARKRNTVFLCGHSACKECADSLINCIRCKQRITKRILMKD